MPKPIKRTYAMVVCSAGRYLGLLDLVLTPGLKSGHSTMTVCCGNIAGDKMRIIMTKLWFEFPCLKVCRNMLYKNELSGFSGKEIVLQEV